MLILDENTEWPKVVSKDPVSGILRDMNVQSFEIVARARHEWLRKGMRPPTHLLIGLARRRDFLSSIDLLTTRADAMPSDDMQFMGLKVRWCEGGRMEILGDSE